MKSESLSVAMELHEDPTAEEQLLAAVAATSSSGDFELEGQARAALGIYYHHQGLSEAACRELNQALKLLPAGLDREAADSHLRSLGLGIPCTCNEELSGLAQAVRAYVMERLPADLIFRFGVQISVNGAVNLDLEVNREPSSAEAQLMEATIDEAINLYGTSRSAQV